MRYELVLTGHLVPVPPEARLRELVGGLLEDFERHGLENARVRETRPDRIEIGIELDARDATTAFLGGRGTVVDLLARRGVRTADVEAVEEPGEPPLAVTFPHWHVRHLRTGQVVAADSRTGAYSLR